MEAYTALRLLPWLSAEGNPCFLVPGDGSGVVSRLADETEARQLAEGLDVCRSARRVLDDPVSPNAEVRYTAIRLTECLADALRVAESRGRRLPAADDETDDPRGTTGVRDHSEPRQRRRSPGSSVRTIVVGHGASKEHSRRSTKEYVRS